MNRADVVHKMKELLVEGRWHTVELPSCHLIFNSLLSLLRPQNSPPASCYSSVSLLYSYLSFFCCCSSSSSFFPSVLFSCFCPVHSSTHKASHVIIHSHKLFTIGERNTFELSFLFSPFQNFLIIFNPNLLFIINRLFSVRLQMESLQEYVQGAC